MLVETDDLSERDQRVSNRTNSRTVGRAGSEERWQWLTSISATIDDLSRRRLVGVTIIEGVRQVGARERLERTNTTTLRDRTDVDHRAAASGIGHGWIRLDVLVIADQHVIEQDVAGEIRGDVRQRSVAVAIHGNRDVAK